MEQFVPSGSSFFKPWCLTAEGVQAQVLTSVQGGTHLKYQLLPEVRWEMKVFKP